MSEPSDSYLSHFRLRALLISAVFVLLAVISLPSVARGQLYQPDVTDLQTVTRVERVWKIFGRVTTLAGDPLNGAKVTVDTAAVKPEVLETNVKGEFSTEISVTTTQYDTIRARIVASKEGYATAHESAEFTAKDNATREIFVMLRENAANADVLAAADLVASLEKRFRAPAARELVPDSVLKDFNKGIDKLFFQSAPSDAAASISKTVAKAPGCINCRLLLYLADLEGDSFASADRQEIEIDKLTSSGKSPQERATLLFIAGVEETWRNRIKNAAGFFQEVLKLQPTDFMALQELGRTQLLLKNWEAADEYLEKAILAGAASEAHLLRSRALLEMSDLDNAQTEMKAYIGDRPVRTLPTTARLTYLDLQQRLEGRSLPKVKSVVDQPFLDLLRAMPELIGVEAAPNQDALPPILQKVGENVEAFFKDFSNTISQEDIRVESLGANGQVRGTRTEKDNYLLMAKPEKWGVGLTEYRATPDGKTVQPLEARPGSMRTKGFASAAVVFHPAAQNDTRFRYLGRQAIDGKDTFVVAFAQQPERAKMVGLIIINGVAEPALVQGIAWVDSQKYEIIRMRTDLLRPLAKVRLARQTTEIHFGEVNFKDTPAGLWLPQEVTVTVQWKGKTYRNSHTYSNFKHFNVAAEEKRKQG